MIKDESYYLMAVVNGIPVSLRVDYCTICFALVTFDNYENHMKFVHRKEKEK